jgi:peptidyl-prolyl cis-trans isomerase SurA
MRSRTLPVAVACLLALRALPAAAEEKLVDGIAAQVGTDIVLVSEVMELVGPVEAQARAQGAMPQEIAKLRAEALERMIERRLIEKVVEDTELFATQAEVNDTIATIAAQNGLSVEDLRSSVTAHGLSYEDYREQIKSEIERRKVVGAMVASRVNVEEEDIRRAYEQRFANQPQGGTNYHLRQILVRYGKAAGRSKAEACAQAQTARSRIEAGADFRAVASQMSDVGAERGGDIGMVHADTAAGWMKKVVQDLEPGEVSPVLEPPFEACGLLQLVSREEFQPISYEMARAALEQEIGDQRMAEAQAEWLEALRQHTFIERKGYFADAARFVRPPPDPDAASEGSSLTP